jgi:Ca-activated chloride channel family protein
VFGELSAADSDLRWAVGVAAFAEILRGSPFAAPALVGNIEGLVAASTGSDVDRLEFVRLVGLARPMLGR